MLFKKREKPINDSFEVSGEKPKRITEKQKERLEDTIFTAVLFLCSFLLGRLTNLLISIL